MKNLLTLLALLATPTLPAQVIDLDGGTTRAVVIGISDYQDAGIPDLRFADRDAEAFAAWLRSPAGGSVPERNIKFLDNEQATSARFVVALDGLIETAKEGDHVIIYFSGHGDVETKTLRQNGFLLCHDTPSAIYVAGALPLGYLQDVVTTLSQQNKAKVIVVTDACRAGKLAGSSINGAQLTSANLAKQFADEVKILSCQPNEFSLEGEQWGGGRGLFSFHLLDGLTGMADKNGDGSVSLFEVGHYLDDHVPAEAAPHSQLPLTVGDRQALLATVDAPTLADLRSAKSTLAATLKGTGMRGWEDDIVAAADSATQSLYHAFAKALKNGEMLDAPEGRSSAADLLPQLLERENLRELHGLLRRNLAAALQDEAQQALNALLNDDPYEAVQWQYNPAKYTRYPEYLAKAIELLGEQHYMYKTLMAKKLFFEASNQVNANYYFSSGVTQIDSINQEARQILDKALDFEPNAAYLYYCLGKSYHYNSLSIDSFFYFQNKAIELSPSWILPRLEIIEDCLYTPHSNDWKDCESHLLQALSIKPDSYILAEKMAWLYQRMFRMEDAIELSWKMTRLRPDLPNGFATLGSSYLNLREYDLAKQYSRKALEIDSTVWRWPMGTIANTFFKTRKYDSLFQIYAEYVKKGYESSTYWIPSMVLSTLKLDDMENVYWNWYYKKYPPNEEEQLFMLSIEIDTLFKKGYLKEAKGRIQVFNLLNSKISASPPQDIYSTLLAQIYELEQRPDSAEYYFQKAINNYQSCSWGRAKCAYDRYCFARFLINKHRYAEAETQLKEAEQIDPHNPKNYLGMAALDAVKEHDSKALDWLAKALEWYYPDYDEIMAEPLFKKIRKTKRFKALMKQYFPNGSDVPRVEKLAKEYFPEIFNH